MFAFSIRCLILFGMLLNTWPWFRLGATNFTGHCAANKKYFFLSGWLNVPLFFNYKAGWIGERDLPSLCCPLFCVPLFYRLLFISSLRKITAICSASLHRKTLPRSQSLPLFVPGILLIPLRFSELGKPKQTTAPGKAHTQIYVYKYIYPSHTPLLRRVWCPFATKSFLGILAHRGEISPRLAEAYALLPVCIRWIAIPSPHLPCLACGTSRGSSPALRSAVQQQTGRGAARSLSLPSSSLT